MIISETLTESTCKLTGFKNFSLNFLWLNLNRDINTIHIYKFKIKIFNKYLDYINTWFILLFYHLSYDFMYPQDVWWRSLEMVFPKILNAPFFVSLIDLVTTLAWHSFIYFPDTPLTFVLIVSSVVTDKSLILYIL